MRWKAETFGDWRTRMGEWHVVFAWFPMFVSAERRVVWLERIERRLKAYHSYTGSYDWEYRLREGD